MKISPVMQQICQIRYSNFCQSGEISPNLVTLLAMCSTECNSIEPVRRGDFRKYPNFTRRRFFTDLLTPTFGTLLLPTYIPTCMSCVHTYPCMSDNQSAIHTSIDVTPVPTYQRLASTNNKSFFLGNLQRNIFWNKAKANNPPKTVHFILILCYFKYIFDVFEDFIFVFKRWANPGLFIVYFWSF